ncbi:MAG: MBL fold metallo-hydrolase [Burkholderiales bacterium PBB5]|nr:MAG: MBL fold metallo-hydrolase [Burkholderiales bacterium PBB5]
MPAGSTLQVEGYFDPATWTISYLVLDTTTAQCALVDSVLDYDPKSGRTNHANADRLVARVRELGASVQWILETHVHADHLSAGAYLQQQLGGRLGIGAHITTVQQVFGRLFNTGPGVACDGRPFDQLFADGEVFHIGQQPVRAMHTPGHTPACMTYVVGEPDNPQQPLAALVGDTLFMPDYGTARCDFPGGDARTLYRSINRVLSLPADTRLYLCHDYQPGGRAMQHVSTVADERAHNIHVRDGICEDAFVTMRQARDATLDMPTLLLPAVQVNMRAGHLPEPESNGQRYLKIPLNQL